MSETTGPAGWQLVIDAADPHALADFWAAALGAEIEDNSALIEEVIGKGWAAESDTIVHHGRRAWSTLAAVRGAGPRLLFQGVPEPKAGKNRVHVDINVGKDKMHDEAARLVALGASQGKEHQEPGGHWIAMTDPEGNEFDLQ